MEKKNSTEELQSRREFFKKAAKGALPILGAMMLAGAPSIVKAVEKTPMGCEWGCMNSCSGGCRMSCNTTCKGGCGSTCRGRCINSCKSCSGSCQGTCSGSCEYTSSGSY